MTMIRDEEIQLNPDLDPEKYARIYRETGRVHIPDILTARSAQRIYDALTENVPWQINFNNGETGYTLHPLQVDTMDDVKRNLLTTHINQSAQQGFQYVFNGYSLSDARDQGINPDLFINKVLDFVNCDEYLDFVKKVTGHRKATYSDSQCTLYRPGHFLSDHNDDMPGKNRLAAYVLNFTPDWKPDYGGILQFIEKNGHISQGICPSFNALNLFKIPQQHSVSYVVPHAGGGRYSITGWLRKG